MLPAMYIFLALFAVLVSIVAKHETADSGTLTRDDQGSTGNLPQSCCYRCRDNSERCEVYDELACTSVMYFHGKPACAQFLDSPEGSSKGGAMVETRRSQGDKDKFRCTMLPCKAKDDAEEGACYRRHDGVMGWELDKRHGCKQIIYDYPNMCLYRVHEVTDTVSGKDVQLSWDRVELLYVDSAVRAVKKFPKKIGKAIVKTGKDIFRHLSPGSGNSSLMEVLPLTYMMNLLPLTKIKVKTAAGDTVKCKIV